MAEPQFFTRPKGMTISEIVTLTGAMAADGVDLSRTVFDVAPIDQAGPSDLTFLENAKFADNLAACRAGAILTTEHFAAKAPAGAAVLQSKEPYRAFIAVAGKLYPESLKPMPSFGDAGAAAGQHERRAGNDVAGLDHGSRNAVGLRDGRCHGIDVLGQRAG